MKVSTLFAFAISVAGSLASGLDQPESFIHHPEEEDRELFFRNKNRCMRDMKGCRAKLEGVKPSKAIWMSALESSDETSFASEFKNIIASIDDVDARRFPAEFAASLVDTDSPGLGTELLAFKAEAVAPKKKFLKGPIKHLVHLITSILHVIEVHVHLKKTVIHFVAQIIIFVARLIIAIPHGLHGRNGILSVVVSSAIFFVAWVLNQIIQIVFFRGHLHRDQDGLTCMGELLQCQFDSFALNAVPTLIGPTILADSLQI